MNDTDINKSEEQLPRNTDEKQDLLAQAQMLRKGQSTADIILDNREGVSISRKSIIYITLSVLILFFLLFLFMSSATRETMSKRTSTLATVLSDNQQTVLEASPENEYKEGEKSETDSIPERSEEPVAIKVGGPPSPPSDILSTDPSPAPKPVSAPAPPETKAVRKAPTKKKPPQPKLPAGPEQEAYRFLITTKPSFASLVEGKSAEYRFQKYTVQTKSERVLRFDFLFLKESSGKETHFIWEVNLEAGAVRPIGLNAARIDRLK